MSRSPGSWRLHRGFPGARLQSASTTLGTRLSSARRVRGWRCMMIRHYKSHVSNGGFAPPTPGFNAVAPEWLLVYGATEAAPAIPAAESTLGSHPCVALPSAQVLPEWFNRNLAGKAFAANGDSPLNFVSHARGSLQFCNRFSLLDGPSAWGGMALLSTDQDTLERRNRSPRAKCEATVSARSPGSDRMLKPAASQAFSN